MAGELNTFPLILKVQEDGGLNGTVKSFETLLTSAADRVATGFQLAGKKADQSFGFAYREA